MKKYFVSFLGEGDYKGTRIVMMEKFTEKEIVRVTKDISEKSGTEVIIGFIKEMDE